MVISLPYLTSIKSCNPLSLRMVNKVSDLEILDGGEVSCKDLDVTYRIAIGNSSADWLITNSAIYYCYPQAEYLREFSFFDWEINTHLGNIVKKRKDTHALRIFKISNHETYNPHLFKRTLDQNKRSVEFYDLYVNNGQELNIATIHSLFKDNKGYKSGV